MLIVWGGPTKTRICHFYNYDPKTKICETNHVHPENNEANQADQKDWETWIPVEPSFHNKNYQHKVESFAERLWSKIVFPTQDDSNFK